MRSFRFALIAAAAVAAASAFALPAISQAQTGGGGASVAVINSDRLLIQSDLGKDLAKKVGDIAKQMQAEVTPDTQRLRGQQQALQQTLQQRQQQGQTAQQVRADPQIRQQVEAIENADRELNAKVNVLAEDLAYTREKSFQDFLQVVDPVLDEVMTQKGITLVLQSSAVAKGRAQTDITQDVLTLLNQRARTMNIVRLKAPPPPQPLAPAAAAPKK
jgi:Skp family chaperone for outer membrane proteins